MPTKMQEPFVKKMCEHCKIGHYVEDSQTGDWWMKCNECNAIIFCYVPMPHQAEFHADKHKYKAFFGGYG